MLMQAFMCILLAAGVSGTEEPSRPTGRQDEAAAIRRLCDATITPVPRKLDILVYRELKLKEESEDKIRQMVKETLLEIQPGQDNAKVEREEVIELNVASIQKEQRETRRIVQRVLQDGERWRMDMTILKPEQTPADAQLVDRYITLGEGRDPRGHNGLQIMGFARMAIILPDGQRFGGAPLAEWLGVPFKLPIQMRFATVDSSGQIAVSPERIQKHMSGITGEAIKIAPTKDPRWSAELDLIELYDIATGQPRVSILCDHENYGRAYEMIIYTPAGTISNILTRNGYLANGFPTEVESIQYDEAGRIVESDKVLFLQCDFAPTFDSGEFDLTPPHGYGLMDRRKEPANQLISMPVESAEDVGDTVRELVAKRPEAAVARNLAAVGMPASAGTLK